MTPVPALPESTSETLQEPPGMPLTPEEQVVHAGWLMVFFFALIAFACLWHVPGEK